MKKYLPLTNGKELEIEVWYGRDMRVRGYYLSVQPLSRTENSVCYTMFSGKTKLLNQVARKSAKAEQEAIKIAERMEAEVIAEVLEKEKLTLKEGAAQ